MNQVVLEAFLARLYVDDGLRRTFVSDPENTALREGLTPEMAAGLRTMDFEGLELAAASYAHKRVRTKRSPWLTRMRRIFSR